MMKKDLNIIVTIRNLKEEAKDDDVERICKYIPIYDTLIEVQSPYMSNILFKVKIDVCSLCSKNIFLELLQSLFYKYILDAVQIV